MFYANNTNIGTCLTLTFHYHLHKSGRSSIPVTSCTQQEPSCPLAPPCKAKLPLQKSTLYFQKCLGALYLHSEAESEELWDQILENPNLNWERVSWLIRVVGKKKLYQFFCIQKLILEEIECVEMQPTLKHCQLCWFLYSSLLRSSGGTFRWPFQSY